MAFLLRRIATVFQLLLSHQLDLMFVLNRVLQRGFTLTFRLHLYTECIWQELGLLLRIAQRMGVRPVIGVRAKLSTRHKGHWGSTSGEKAKFGLRPREVVAVVRQLAAFGMTDCLQLLHFHIGSQVGPPPRRRPCERLKQKRMPV